MNRPSGRSVAIITAGVLVAITLVIVGLTSGGERAQDPVPTRAPAPVVVVGGGEQRSATPALSDAGRAAARQTALAFARSYVPILYGQAPARHVAKATRYVRQSLRGARRPPRDVRRRHPRLQGLELTVQTSRSALARATVRDGVSPPFAVIFTVERRDNGWVVSGLAND
jgi:hypothetical protein